jgi:hypothetical protein
MTINEERKVMQEMLDRISRGTIATEKMCLELNLGTAEKSGNEPLKVRCKAALQTIENIELSLGALAWLTGLRFPHLPECNLKLVVNNK